MTRREESFEDIKYLLGNMGIEILVAIDKGAKDFETIEIFSGVPLICIKGRIPVLLDLNLVIEKQNGYSLTQKGFSFKNKIEKFS